MKFETNNIYDDKDIHRPSAALNGNQRDYRVGGHYLAPDIAHREVPRHSSPHRQRMGKLPRGKCRRSEKSRRGTARRGYQRSGQHDLHDIAGKQRLCLCHHILQARHQSRHGGGERAEPCVAGHGSAAFRGGAHWREHREATAGTTAHYRTCVGGRHLRRGFPLQLFLQQHPPCRAPHTGSGQGGGVRLAVCLAHMAQTRRDGRARTRAERHHAGA